MMKLKVDKLANAKILERAKGRVLAQANRAFRSQVYRMFEDLVLVSPQFSGEFAANWRIATTSMQGTPVTWANKRGKDTVVQQAGDLAAFSFARERMARIPFKYTDKVYFVNDVDLKFTSTTVTDSKGDTHRLRDENILKGFANLQSYIRFKYK